jgi:hypothetical protein
MISSPTPRASERRRYPRIPVGLAVRVHFAGRTIPLTVELADVSRGGCYFQGASAPADARVAFGFILPGRQVCVAAGQVLRVDPRGFAVAVDRANEGFTEFLSCVSGPIAASAA